CSGVWSWSWGFFFQAEDGIRGFHVTGVQTCALPIFRDLGEVTIGTIADNVSLSQATVTTILDRLELRKLVYRVRSTQDKRKVHAHLTEAGAELLARAPNPLQEDFIEKFQSLAEWEQTMILASDRKSVV